MVPITSIPPTTPIPPGYPPTSIPNHSPHPQVNPNHDELLCRFISEFSEFPEISNENVATRTADPEPEASNIPPPTEPLLALTGERGDLAIRGFWEKQTECIFDVRITNTDALSRIEQSKSVKGCLEAQEKEKKDKYLKSCLERRRHFTPFVVSVDGVLGDEALTTLRRLSRKLAGKWKRPYPVILGYVKAKISLSVLRAVHQCVRGSRNTLVGEKRFTHMDDGAGISLVVLD